MSLLPLVLMLSTPALPCGVVIGSKGVEAGETADMTTVFVRDEDRTTTVLRMSMDVAASDFAWLIPVPAPLVSDRVDKVPPEALDTLVWGTDPRVGGTTWGCGISTLGMYGCASDSLVGDSGAAGVEVHGELDVGPYEVLIFDAEADTEITAWLRGRGYVVPQDVEVLVDRYLDLGWIFLAVELQLDEVPSDTRDLPALAWTTTDPRAVVPLVIAKETSATDIEALVLSLSPSGLAPAQDPWVAAAGADLEGYLGQEFRSWYTQRTRALLDEAGDRAWALEYNRFLSDVDGESSPARDLLDELVDLGLVRERALDWSPTLTRYRTWLTPDDLDTDLELVDTTDLPELEIALPNLVGSPLPLAPLVLVSLSGFLVRRRE